MDTTEPTAAPERVTLSLSESERVTLARLTAEKHLTPEQLLRVALATYGVVSEYRRTTDEPMPWERHRFDEPFGAGLAE